jgi:hypothetical protein
MIGSYWLGTCGIRHWNSEDSIPAPDLRFLENKVQEDLEVRRIDKVKRLGIQRLNGSFKMLRPTRRSEIDEVGSVGQRWCEREDRLGSYLLR